MILCVAAAAGEDAGEKVRTMTTTSSAPAHTNRLVSATSPYLLQHAHNPVDWYPWGPEALEKARREDKPIFLSIGYSACHWCHVMERESFENESLAKVLNEHFVSIKVDREERPDLDDLYMKATVLYNQGQGGWPMSVFLTPDRKPFFAGTYFPPESRYGRPGFRDVLLKIAEVWKDERPKVLQGADSLTDAVKRYAVVEPGKDLIPHEVVGQCAGMLARAFDPDTGGMSGGGTNKFPPSMAMDLMLRTHRHSQTTTQPQAGLMEAVRTTLDHMAHGGIYDQLGGGIARYSTDVRWLAPHFEKMLYDQALVTGIYLDAYQATHDPLYGRIAREICEYVIGDLQSPEGGYYSTRDADSEGVEGKYYVWSKAEVMAALGARDGELFCSYYDVSEHGNWEEQNILNVPRGADVVAKLNKVSESELAASLAASRVKLLAIRGKRVEPHLDDKVLASWNGLMIASMARAGCVLDEPRFVESARRAAEFVLTRMQKDGRLLRTYRAGKTHTPGYLDDYAFFIEGLINLYEATFDLRWLEEAARLTDVAVKHFRDEKGGFFFGADDAEEVLVRSKDADDGAIPSGNSVMMMNLLRLSAMLDRKAYAGEAEGIMRAFGTRVKDHPASAERMLAAVDYYWSRPTEVVIMSASRGAETAAMLRTVWQTYLPNKVVVGAIGAADAAAAKMIPLLADRKAIDGKPTAYVCENFVCKRPTTSVDELKKMLEEPARGVGR